MRVVREKHSSTRRGRVERQPRRLRSRHRRYGQDEQELEDKIPMKGCGSCPHPDHPVNPVVVTVKQLPSEPGNLAIADVDADGKTELLFIGCGFSSVLR